MNLAQLLYRGESESLDFKRDQYPFISADDSTKSELLKDILAMANSWRNESAHILIGIDESARPPQVVGISEHLDDAMLQQFVNGKTQRPLKFSYYATEIGGRAVGVIEIPVQSRPIFLRKNFGKLRPDTVYLRRGSSTGEASPDEIAEMGASSLSLRESDVRVCFAKPDSRELWGDKLEFESIVYHVNEEPDIPDFKPPHRQEPWGARYSALDENPNVNFYRELVQRTKQDNLLRPAAITVTNAGTMAAKEIRVEFILQDENRNWEFCEEDDFVTNFPQSYHSMLFRHHLHMPIINRHWEPKYEFRYLEGNWHLTFEFGHLQPGRTLWPTLKFYVGARESRDVELQGRIMADGLPAAVNCTLKLSARASETRMTLSEVEKNFYKLIKAKTS